MPEKREVAKPPKVPTPKTERIQKEIVDRGFTMPELVNNRWVTHPAQNGTADINQPITAPYIGELFMKISEISNGNGKDLPNAPKMKAAAAPAPAKIEEPEETEEEAKPQEMKKSGDGLEYTKLSHDPATGQQYVPGIEPQIPAALAVLVVDEFDKKKAFTSANNEFQEAKKKRDEEAAKPQYAHLFKPDKKHPKRSFLIAGHVKLEHNVEETIKFKSVPLTPEELEDLQGENPADAEA